MCASNHPTALPVTPVRIRAVPFHFLLGRDAPSQKLEEKAVVAPCGRSSARSLPPVARGECDGVPHDRCPGGISKGDRATTGSEGGLGSNPGGPILLRTNVRSGWTRGFEAGRSRAAERARPTEVRIRAVSASDREPRARGRAKRVHGGPIPLFARSRCSLAKTGGKSRRRSLRSLAVSAVVSRTTAALAASPRARSASARVATPRGVQNYSRSVTMASSDTSAAMRRRTCVFARL
jgi:hypothetical protein